MAKQKIKLVHCRYPKCKFLHETTELHKDDAVKSDSKGSTYYHPDCYHTMQTVNQIRDLFVQKINPAMTDKQIGALVSIINHLIFEKHFDVDYIKFALQWFTKLKPGALKHPAGLHYVVQDEAVKEAWEKEQNRVIDAELERQKREAVENVVNNFVFDLPQNVPEYNPHNKSRFSRVLGV